MPASNPDPKSFLLFLPEGELHEIGLLFYNYMLRKKGHKVTYLGQWVPLDDMAAASTVLNMDYLVTSIVSAYSGSELLKYLKDLSAAFAMNTIFIGGLQTSFLTDELPENIIRLDSVYDLYERIR
jgi:methanogenic corrinoid protein MtbC1